MASSGAASTFLNQEIRCPGLLQSFIISSPGLRQWLPGKSAAARMFLNGALRCPGLLQELHPVLPSPCNLIARKFTSSACRLGLHDVAVLHTISPEIKNRDKLTSREEAIQTFTGQRKLNFSTGKQRIRIDSLPAAEQVQAQAWMSIGTAEVWNNQAECCSHKRQTTIESSRLCRSPQSSLP